MRKILTDAAIIPCANIVVKELYKIVKVIGGEKWTQDEPLNYYWKVRNGRHFHLDTEVLLLRFLETIKDKGLDEFHKMARCEGEYVPIRKEYKEDDI